MVSILGPGAEPPRPRRAGGIIRIGCAGWSVPRVDTESFAVAGCHLQRYASRFDCVEINSSFYRAHKPLSYSRWATSVPAEFRFSVKMPRTITHDLRLVGSGVRLNAFFTGIGELGDRLGCVLIQLPPSLPFDRVTVRDFLAELRDCYRGHVALEPRHATWFSANAGHLLADHSVARVSADPAMVAAAALPGAAAQLVYFRLHGTPRMYYSTYSHDALVALTERVRSAAAASTQVWCIFDNTARGAAIPNALELQRLLQASRRPACSPDTPQLLDFRNRP